MSVHLVTGFSDNSRPQSNALACDAEVLILSRDGELISDVETALEGAHPVQHARRTALAIDMLTERNVGVLVTDAANERAAFQVLARRLERQFPHLVIVGVGDRDEAVSLIELFNDGLVDRILLKPLSVDQVRQQVQSALRQHLRGADGNHEVPIAPEDPPDWDEDNTEPQSDIWLVGSRPDVLPSEPRSDILLAEPRPDVSLAQTQAGVSLAKSLPAVWIAPSLPVANRASRKPLLIGGVAAALVAAFALALMLQGSELTGWRDRVDGSTSPATRAAASAQSPSDVQRALATASAALRESRYISPAQDNALDHYLGVLEIEPEHSQAMAGLDTITGVLLQQAQTALSKNDPEDALAARRLARDLRPDHPAMRFVNAAFADHGKSLIASTDLAFEPDDLSRASAQLDLAARFLPPGSADLAVARARLVERRSQLAIDDRLALANERMEASNLTVSENDSAEFHLLALRADYPEDEKVASGLERLADMLLKRSDAAILGEDFAAAARWLNKADELGAREEALTARREALANVARQTAAAEAVLNEEAALTEAALQEELALAAAALQEELALSEAGLNEAASFAGPESETVVAGTLETGDREPVLVASTTQMVTNPEAGAGVEVDTGSVEIRARDAAHGGARVSAPRLGPRHRWLDRPRVHCHGNRPDARHRGHRREVPRLVRPGRDRSRRAMAVPARAQERPANRAPGESTPPVHPRRIIKNNQVPGTGTFFKECSRAIRPQRRQSEQPCRLSAAGSLR